MHKPSSATFALGHRAGVALTTGALAAACLAWAQSAVSWFVPLLALALCRAAFTARRKALEWSSWNAQWNEMSTPEPLSGLPAAPYPAQAPAPAPGPARERSQTPRQALLVTWALLLCWLWTDQHKPATPIYGAGVLLFLAITAIGVGSIAVGLFRPARPARVDRGALAPGRTPYAPASEHVVSQVLPVSPEILPDYVQTLLKRDEPPR
jgi:hypothetical protein